MLWGGDVKNVEKEWEKFRVLVKECTKDACGIKRVVEEQRLMAMSEW